MRIGVIGCGVAGMAAAAFLTRGGRRVEVFERFAEPRPVGAGLLLQPSGLSALARLDLDRAACARGARVARLDGFTASGRRIFDLAYADLAPRLFGLGIHRAALFDLLHGAMRAAGATLHCGWEAASFRESAAGATIVDIDGRAAGPFDLVVVADGSASALRAQVAGREAARLYPWGCVWGVAEDREGRFQGALNQRYAGARRMMGVLPIGRPNADGAGPPLVALFWSLKGDEYESWRDAGLAAWRAEAEALWPETAPLLDQLADPDQMILARYRDVTPKRQRAGRVLLIGDAAHGTSPQLGQGANLALLDAALLADALEGAADGQGVEERLDGFLRLRRRQIAYYRTASRWLTPFFQSESRLLAALRDLTFGPACRLPPSRALMLATLAGVRDGGRGLPRGRRARGRAAEPRRGS